MVGIIYILLHVTGGILLLIGLSWWVINRHKE